MTGPAITWVLERDVFAGGDTIRTAASAAGHRVIDWSDEWWSNSRLPQLTGEAVFHGSLGNADRVRRELPWRPGSYCQTADFYCSAWYPAARRWLLHEHWEIHPASKFIANSDAILDHFGTVDSVFVRPDSPLKPFSGRVVHRGQISFAALDFGFYYDDAELPVVIAPRRRILREWRYVIVREQVVAGSGYVANGRAATPDDPHGLAWQFAAELAVQLTPPDSVYVLDVCETDTGLRLLELNPFSGADLYACNASEIVRHVSELASNRNN
jgi:ATP-grasp domain, R2K clade family 3